MAIKGTPGQTKEPLQGGTRTHTTPGREPTARRGARPEEHVPDVVEKAPQWAERRTPGAEQDSRANTRNGGRNLKNTRFASFLASRRRTTMNRETI